MKTLYIGGFMVFGFLFQLMLHGLLEIWYISLLLDNFNRYSFGFGWADLDRAHDIFSTVFTIGGLYLGYRQGKFWWRRIYEPIPWFRPLQKLNYTR